MIGFEIIIHIIILLYEIISSKIMCRSASTGKHTPFWKLSLGFGDSAIVSSDVEYLTSDTITSSTFHKPNKLPFSNELSFTSFSLLGVKQYITVITMEWCFCSVLNLTLIDIMLPRRRIVLWRITCSGLICDWDHVMESTSVPPRSINQIHLKTLCWAFFHPVW